MASQPSKLEGYIIKEFSQEFGITNKETLRKMAAALSRAVHTYITVDVETKQGQQVQVNVGTGAGQTVGPGDLF